MCQPACKFDTNQMSELYDYFEDEYFPEDTCTTTFQHEAIQQLVEVELNMSQIG